MRRDHQFVACGATKHRDGGTGGDGERRARPWRAPQGHDGGRGGARRRAGRRRRATGRACADGRARAGARLGALEARLHAARPAGYAVRGVAHPDPGDAHGRRARGRRLYRAADGAAHFLLDEHLGWPPRQAATPACAALLADLAADVPFARRGPQAGGGDRGALAGHDRAPGLSASPRGWRQPSGRRRGRASPGRGPEPAGARVVGRALRGGRRGVGQDPAGAGHRHGLRAQVRQRLRGLGGAGGADAGAPPAPLRAGRQAGLLPRPRPGRVPFWEGAQPALHRTYDLDRLAAGRRRRRRGQLDRRRGRRLLAGGPPARRLPPGARRRAGLGAERGRPALRGARTAATGATRTLRGAPPRAASAPPRQPGPAAAPPRPPGPGPARAPRPRRRWRGRAPPSGAGRRPAPARGAPKSPPQEVPPDARGLGTQEGTNAHLLARRMKRRGCSWTVPGARAMAKARELVTNGTLAPWCLPPPPPTRRPRAPRRTGLPAPPAALAPRAVPRAPTAPPATRPSPTSSASSPAADRH